MTFSISLDLSESNSLPHQEPLFPFIFPSTPWAGYRRGAEFQGHPFEFPRFLFIRKKNQTRATRSEFETQFIKKGKVLRMGMAEELREN